MTLDRWGEVLFELWRGGMILVGGWTLGSWAGSRIWPRPPHRCVVQLRMRRNIFVNADPDMLVTQGDDGVMEIEGYAIMPRSTYCELARQIGWEAPEQ